MLKDPASIALAAFFSFLGISISIYQVGLVVLACSGCCTVLGCACLISRIACALQILCHLRNYTEPVFQVSL
jgi:hypothetical protein